MLRANIFAYCNNNPVINVDYTGEESDKKKAYAKGIIGIIIALIVLTVLYNCAVAVNIDAVRDSL